MTASQQISHLVSTTTENEPLGGRLKLLSNPQLKALRVSKLSKETFENMFPWCGDNTADRERFANFEATEVQAAIEAGILTTTYRLKLLSNPQLKALRVSKLSKETLDNMFPWCGGNTADREQFANFEATEVQAALDGDKLSEYQVKLISIKQRKKIDFSILPQKIVNMFFPHYSVDYLREEHSHWGNSLVVVNGKVLENKQGKQCIYSEEKLQEMSQDQKQKNEKLLAQLSPKQRQDLQSRLYQKDDSTENSSTRDSSQPHFDSFHFFFDNFFQQEFGSGFFLGGLIHSANFLGKDLLLGLSLVKAKVMQL